MKPDKYKKKDYLKADRSDYDDMIRKDPKIHQIKDDDELDELASKGKNNLAYRGRYFSNAVDRFLRKNIGRKWNDVYSELSNKLDHKVQDIGWRVELNAFKEDNRIVSIGYCGVQEVRGFYVLDGILGEIPKKKYKADTSKVKVTFVESNVVFKHKGLFFKAPMENEVMTTFIWISDPSANYKRTDEYVVYTKVIDKKRVKYAIPARYIRQLNSSEMSKWDLPNTEINENLGWRYL